MLHKVTKVCTLLWFNRKCSVSAVRNVLSYCMSFEQEKRKVCGCNAANLAPVKNFGLWVPLPPSLHPFLSDGVLLHCLQTWRNFSVETDTHAEECKGQYIHSCKLSKGLRESKTASGRTFLIRFDHSMCQNEKMTSYAKKQMPLLEYVGTAFH